MQIPPVNRLLLANLLFFMVLQTIGFAQDARQQERLMQLSERSARDFTMNKAKALRLADSLRLPVRVEQADGRIMELMRFEMGQPVYYTTFNAGGAILINTDKVYPGGLAGFSLTGSGQRLGIWDGGKVRATHQEFTNAGGSRVTQRDGASSLSDHATHVAGTLIAGGVDAAARGMSFEAMLDAYDWNNDNAEMAAAAAAGLKVSQHSYGYLTGWNYSEGDWYWHGNVNISETEDHYFGFYCDEARMWDEIAHNAPSYLIVKSAGNYRGRGPAPGTRHYVRIGGSWVESTATRDINGGADGYDCISRNGTAKNILAVGAIYEDRSMTSFSAWGPTDDGRVKPDLVAKGFGVTSSLAGSDSDYANYNGTSMAGPMVSGSVGLLLQHQEDLHPGISLQAATIKALLLHTADDMVSGAEGPDYRFGWGLMDTQKAVALMTDNTAAGGIHIHEETIVQNGRSPFRSGQKAMSPCAPPSYGQIYPAPRRCPLSIPQHACW